MKFLAQSVKRCGRGGRQIDTHIHTYTHTYIPLKIGITYTKKTLAFGQCLAFGQAFVIAVIENYGQL